MNYKFLRNAMMGPQGFIHPVFAGPGRALIIFTDIVYGLLRRAAAVNEY
jgi:hypothetical protein